MLNYSFASIDKKLEAIEDDVYLALKRSERALIFDAPLRAMPIMEPAALPRRASLASQEGQLRLIHDLGNIELQAMELALRTLLEFPEAPSEFREALAELCLSEAHHFKLTLKVLRDHGKDFGDWPVHMGLWNATHSDQTLLERILVVHRYLEGSGLDAGAEILHKLRSVRDLVGVQPVVATIAKEEVDHVAFGSHWYRALCVEMKVDSESLFQSTMRSLYQRIPKREPIHVELRQRAGFSTDEILFLNALREKSLFR